MKQQKTAIKENRSLEERACDLEKVITFNVIRSVTKHWKTVASFKESYSKIISGKASNGEQCMFCGSLSFTKKFYRKILGSIHDENGLRTRWITLDDIKPFLPSWLHLQKAFTKHYKSGKSFRIHSYWYIEFSKLEELLADERWLHYNCKEIYTKRQRDLIWNVVLKKKKKESSEVAEKEQDLIENSKLEAKEEDMTKAERE